MKKMILLLFFSCLISGCYEKQYKNETLQAREILTELQSISSQIVLPSVEKQKIFNQKIRTHSQSLNFSKSLTRIKALDKQWKKSPIAKKHPVYQEINSAIATYIEGADFWTCATSKLTKFEFSMTLSVEHCKTKELIEKYQVMSYKEAESYLFESDVLTIVKAILSKGSNATRKAIELNLSQNE